jgi:tripartite-type tricarboxylate transporter receptor subunit TctC
LSSGFELIGGSPDEFAATIKSELAKWSKVLKEAGISAN